MAAASALPPCRPHPVVDATLPALIPPPFPRVQMAIRAVAKWKAAPKDDFYQEVRFSFPAALGTPALLGCLLDAWLAGTPP